MSLQPKIRRILVPPAVVPTKASSPAVQLAAVTHLARHSIKESSTSTASASASAPTAAVVGQRHVAQHPVQTLLAYVLETTHHASGVTSSSPTTTSSSSSPNHHHHTTTTTNSNGVGHSNNLNNHAMNKVITVQNTVTQEIVYSLHWLDLAATVYGESDPKKLYAAAKALGTILSLQFYDPSVLFWSRICVGGGTPEQQRPISATSNGSSTGSSGSSSYSPSPPPERWQILAVQTDKRVLLLNLRRGSSAAQVLYTTTVGVGSSTTDPHHNEQIQQQRRRCIVPAHVCEKTVGAVPSSNVLPVSERWLLVGCTDGSIKCYDWTTSTVVKKIKGLGGKGDYVVQLLAANPYYQQQVGGSTKPYKRRILTVTKRGIVYLIELEFSSKHAVDMQTPTARFQIGNNHSITTAGSTELGSSNDANSSGSGTSSMEHTTYSYDAHTDRFQWFVPTSSQNNNSNKEGPVLYVWNLKTLQQQQQPQVKPTLLKPEPTLIIHFPAVSSAVGSTNLSSSTTGLTTPTHKDHHHHYASHSSESKEAATAAAVLTSASSLSQGAVTVLSGLVHPAFAEDTVVMVSLTASGDLCLHGAVALAVNTTATVQATPCMGVHLKQAIVHAIASMEDATLPLEADFKVHAVTACPLQSPGTGTTITVATNWGLVVLELPVYSSSNAFVESRSASVGSRHLHFGAGLGSLGKSTMTVQHSSVTYGSLDVLAATANPVGLLEPRNIARIYECPLAHHMPAEFSRRPFRLAPVMLQSPSGVYVCLFWPCEFRYEILHAASLLQMVGPLRAGNTQLQRRNPVVATGTGIGDFGWVSDEDVFAVLHAPDWQEQAASQVPKLSGEESGSYNLTLLSPNLKMIGAGALGVAGNVANLATSVKKTATIATLSATKLATSAAVNTTMTVTKGATNAANMTVGVTTKAFRSGAKGVTKGVKKSFGIFGGKRKNKSANDSNDGSVSGSIMTADDDDDDDEESSKAAKNAAILALQQQGLSSAEFEAIRTPNATAVRQRYVELKGLEAVEKQSIELMGGLPAATCFSLGELTLRGGNRNVPTVIFGGPVLCVASRSDEDKEGHAHFYSLKKDAKDNSDNKASSYHSSGPTLPYPDLVVWDDDGSLCAFVVQNRVAVYLSNEPVFDLLGTVRVGSPSVPTAEITSAKFVHGALYCCTWNSVHVVLLGDLEGGICRLDTYLLASTDVPMIPERSPAGDIYTSLAPVHLPLPLVLPSVLGYQSGSLIVSTLRGVHAIPLSSPLMRIGLFLAADQNERAAKWFDFVPNSDHEALAAFLERRGQPEMALQLPGLSLETIVDMSMRYGYVDRLEDIVETYGVGGLRAIDMGRGVSPTIFGPEYNVHSVVVCVGAYLLAHGNVELTRRLATECLRSEGEGKKDAFFLGALLLPVDESDATRLIQRAVGEDVGDDWMIGEYVRRYVL